MKYSKLKNIDTEEFRRLTGVKPETFKKMAMILGEAEKEKEEVWWQAK